MFSIIIPLYNKEKEITKTLLSAITAFKNHEHEIIIVNDGSTDNSLSVVSKIVKGYDNISIINQVNGGVSNARNEGIRTSKFDYLVFLDADDYLFDHTGDEYYKLITECGDDFGIYSVGYAITNGDNRKMYDCNRAFGSDKWFGEVKNPIELLSRYQGSSFIQTSAICVNKNIQKKHNIFFPEGVTHTEDVAFFYDFMLVSKIAYSSKLCTNYCVDATNRSDSTKPVQERFISTKIREMESKKLIPEHLISCSRSFSAKNYIHLCYNCIESGNINSFKDNMTKTRYMIDDMSKYYKRIFYVFRLVPFFILYKLSSLR